MFSFFYQESKFYFLSASWPRQVHAAVVEEAAVKFRVTNQIPENIYINLINRLAKEAPRPLRAAEAQGAAEDAGAGAETANHTVMGESKGEQTWSEFFLLLLPWKLLEDGSETLTLIQPAVRFLTVRGKSSNELVRICDRCLAQKMVNIIKSGRDSRDALVNFSLEFLQFLRSYSADGQDKVSISWRNNCTDLVTAILAIAGAGKPGWTRGYPVHNHSCIGHPH